MTNRFSVNYESKRIRAPAINNANSRVMSDGVIYQNREEEVSRMNNSVRNVSESEAYRNNAPAKSSGNDTFEFMENGSSQLNEAWVEDKLGNSTLDIISSSNGTPILPPFKEVSEESSSINSRSSSPAKSVLTNTSGTVSLGSIIGAYNSRVSLDQQSSLKCTSQTNIRSSSNIQLGSSTNETTTNTISNTTTPIQHSAHTYLPLQGTIKDRPVSLYEKPPTPTDTPTGPSHTRHGSASSTASNASTITAPKDRRFVQYVINKQTSSTNWTMDSVIKWLDDHKFNQSWKDTFRRNEISGNRFLELRNYDVDSVIWKQFGKFLSLDLDLNSISRFIRLLKEEEDGASYSPPEENNTSRKSSSDSSGGFSTKLDNRKSLATLATASSANTANTLTPVPIKQRPFSYIAPSNKNKDPYKFFRKHNRTSSNEERNITLNSIMSNSNMEIPKKASSKQSSFMGNDEASSLRSPVLSLPQQSQQLQQSQPQYPNSPISSQPQLQPGSKKDRFINTFRRGDRKSKLYPLNLNTQSSSQNNISPQNSTFPFAPPSPSATNAVTPPTKVGTSSQSSVNSLPSSQKARQLTPKQVASLSSETFTGDDYDVEFADVPEMNDYDDTLNFLDEKYLPKANTEVKPRMKTILLSKDNVSFSSTEVDLNEQINIKNHFVKILGLLDIGSITVHLTDFGAQEGHALPENKLYQIVESLTLPKFFVRQELSSPSINTYSTTSSDSKSFELKGETDEKTYPATPQYLLQGSQEAKVDYWTFKEVDRLPKIQQSPKKPASGFKVSQAVPQTHSHGVVPLNGQFSLKLDKLRKKQPLLQIDTNVTEDSTKSNSTNTANTTSTTSLDPNNAENTSRFRVIRKEGNEIDFNKRRKSPYESKAPKPIPNIYSSSVGSAGSPILATTVSTLRDTDDKKSVAPVVSQSDTINEEIPPSKTSSIRAKRAPPPPPLNRSVSSINRKPTMSSLVSTFSEDSSFSSSRSNSGSDRSMSLRRGLTKQFKKRDPFKQNDISFEVLPDESCQNEKDEFFVKKVSKKPMPTDADGDADGNGDGDGDDDHDDDNDDDDDFFMKPVRNKNIQESRYGKPTSKMKVRPPIEEVYLNLEKYFPNTNLDKPIIDDSPVSPVCSAVGDIPVQKKPTISRTFSNANISPNKVISDETFNSDGAPSLRKMKTIRIVANEARRKRLERKTSPDISRNSSGKMVTSIDEEIESSRGDLTRRNTKMWGQKVIEVTSKEIDKGFVSKIRNNKNGEFEEFAWIKGELIGRGSFGAVYLALNVTTGEMLAVKQVVVPSGIKSLKTKDGIEALHKEVETMKDLDHVNIVQYLGFEQKDNTYSLFLEYVAGGSIAMCMKLYGPFEEDLVRFLTRQILSGLEYLHVNGILHRDLKSDNLLLEVDGICKISDFGISKRSSDIYTNNAEMSMQGTIFWMAPEVIDSIVEDKKQGYSAKIDVWSLGCVVLEMFAGKRPWSNEAVVSAIYKIGKTKLAPPVPSDIIMSSAARDFISKCFTINPDLRPTAKQLLEHEFMKENSNFKFQDTRLAKLIEFRKKSVPKQ